MCGPCAARVPAFDTARSAFVYTPESRQLVLSLKHGGRVDGLAAFGGWMKRAGADVLDGADLLVPVPLHGQRLRKRRFNQSLLLARALTRLTGIRTDPHMLVRTRATPSQGGRSAKGRRRNVAGAFRVRAGRKPRLEGAHIVIIDDVYTTGATLEACARALKRAGAARVDALTLARVVKPADVIT
ncbi:MAG: ComF family protein [Oceanicaulis sp.]|nr:ComF family protein [Oceanicaulis sp.]